MNRRSIVIGMQKTALKPIYWRILFFSLLAIVTHQSLVPVPASVLTHWSDKILHVGAWSTVMIALRLAFPQVKSLPDAFLPLLGYSTLIEIGQILVPGRSFSGLDILANGIGCSLGLLVAAIGCSMLRE